MLFCHGDEKPFSGEFPRPFSDRETEVLHFLLGLDDDRLSPLRQQAHTAVVTRTCPCGCASIDLAVDQDSTDPVALCSPVVSADSIEGVPRVGLLLFLDAGWLSLLEIWWIDSPPAEFPAATFFDRPRIECDR